MNEKYPDGIMVFAPHKNAPDFVKGSVVITPNDLIAWMKKNDQFKSDYNGKTQYRFQLKEGKKGLYLEADTYKAPDKKVEKEEDSLPF